MKKNIQVIAIVFVALTMWTVGSVFAGTETPMQAGVAAEVKGEVKATTPPEKAAHLLKDGDPIFMGDKIETGAEGQLQIRLLDQTFFSLGPLSSIMVDEFIYDPRNAGAKASMMKGILRTVSDKTAQKSSEDASDRSDSASAGLRM